MRSGFRFILVLLCICSAAAPSSSSSSSKLCVDAQAKAAMPWLNDNDLHLHSSEESKSRETTTTQNQKLAQELMMMARQLDEIRNNFQSILENQKEFAAMEANTSAAVENMLHMAILVHSQQWFIRAFFFYCLVAFLLYMLTTAEQTFHIRGHLCLGFCASIMLEAGVIILGADDDYSAQLSKVLLLRSVLFAAATVHIMHSIVRG